MAVWKLLVAAENPSTRINREGDEAIPIFPLLKWDEEKFPLFSSFQSRENKERVRTQ